MLSHFKEFVNQNKSDLLLTVFIILITLISFGIGRLTASSSSAKPIIIEQPTASINQSFLQNNQQLLNNGTAVQKTLVGSINSDKYHWPDCPWVKKIAPKNQIWFSSEAEAQAAGYTRCGNFEKYIPEK
jgi:hypothetical protein